ncbi:MAG: DUF58 domain-containing protein [Eubacteriales bacterium]|nr:DUF58 domain-containing protein [Eubacteriales bacterium]
MQRQKAYVERGETAYWHFDLSSSSLWASSYIYASYLSEQGGETEYLNPFPVKAKEKLRISLELTSRHTGPLRPYSLELRILDPMGFFSLKLSSFQAEAFDPILVLPRSLVSILDKEESRAYLDEGEAISKKSDFDLDEIDLIRPLRPGDNRRDVHWKLSARLQEWMVRQYEKADENELFFVFNLPAVSQSENAQDRAYHYLVRDLVLDHVSEAAQSFLSQGYKLNIRLRRPWRDQLRVDSLDEYNSLRIQLASLPLEPQVDFTKQLSEESLEGLAAFYCIFSAELNEEITSELLILASQAQGILLRLIHTEPNPPQSWKVLIRRLSAAGVRVSLNRQPMGMRGI